MTIPPFLCPLLFDKLTYIVYNIAMTEKYTQLRIRRTTLNNLRMIYALTGESMIAVAERLAEQELQRLADVKPTETVQVLGRVNRVEGEE